MGDYNKARADRLPPAEPKRCWYRLGASAGAYREYLRGGICGHGCRSEDMHPAGWGAGLNSDEVHCFKKSDDDFQNTIHTMWYFVFLSPKASFDFNKALCPHCQAIQWEDCRRVTRPIARGKQHSICNHFRIARQYGIQGFECWHDWCHWTHPKCMANRHHQWTGVSWVNVYIISIHPSMSFKRLDDLSLNLSILSEGTTNSIIWQIGEAVLSRTWLDMLLCM